MSAETAPSPEQSSYRRILTSTSIIGGATVATILIGLVRTKLLAVLAGPEGIGILGLLTNISALVGTLANFGLAFAAVREIAATDEEEVRRHIQRALWAISLPLAFLGGLLLWFARDPITRLSTDDQSLAILVGLSGITVVLIIIGSVQQSILQGLQRVTALGWVKVGSAVLSTVLAVAALAAVPGKTSLLLVTMAVPLSVIIVALPFAPSLRTQVRLSTPGHGEVVGLLFRLGIVVTITGSLNQLGLLAIRSFVVRESGLEVAGLYQAVVTITTMNIGLILGSMSADYYPRLSASSHDRVTCNRIFNEQLHVALLLGTPLLIGLVAGAPLVLRLLFTSQFAGAETMLRWQLLGDLLKIPGWAMGFVLLALGRRKLALLSELAATSVLVGAAVLLIPLFGLDGAGMAYLSCYVLYGVLIAALCARLDVRISTGNFRLLMFGMSLAGGVFLMSIASERLALGAGIVFVLLTGVLAVRGLGDRAGLFPRNNAASNVR